MTVILDGKRLRSARIAKGLSQEQFAELCELSDRHVRNLERGNVDPSASTLCRVCLILGLPMAELLIVVCDDEA